MARGKPRQKADRRARFAREYAKNLNATQAAIRAGYAPKSAKVTGSRLLSDANVSAQVAEIFKRVGEEEAITVERTKKAIARIAYGDIRQLFDEHDNLRPIRELSEDEAAMLAGVESFEEYQGRGEEREAVGLVRKVKIRDTIRALEQTMSILGMHKTAVPPGTGDLNLTIRLSGGKVSK